MATIVALDDDDEILELLRALIAESGHDAITASTLEAIPAQARVDLVITDLLPLSLYRREPAAEWVAEIRQRFPDARVIVVTAHSGALAEPDRLGADAVIGKPFEVDEFLETIETWLPAAGGPADHMRKTP